MLSYKKVYSFDVFDTCIVRSCGTYNNFLEILSYRVFRAIVSDAIRHKFIYARRLSESELLDKNGSIFEIYKNLKFNHPLLFDREELAEIEIRLENEVDLPVYSIKEQITILRGNGHKIMFISDMYMGEKILRPILAERGLLEKEDKVYVSCDVGFAKHDKSLFEYIKKEEKIEFKEWVHTGDNYASDYSIPSGLGIKSVLFQSTLSRYQKNWINKCFDNEIAASFPYVNVLTNISKSVLTSEKGDSRKKFIIDIVAPLYCSYLFQVFSIAKKNSVKKLFFLARDTFQLYQVATVINTQYPDIVIKYLPISRSPLYYGDKAVLLDYLIQEGLADKDNKCEIIDTSSSGQTVVTINKLLKENNYNEVYASNILLHINTQYFSSISDGDFYAYISQSWEKKDFIECALIESIFSTNNEKRVSNLIRSGEKILVEYDINPQNSDVIQENTQEYQLMQSELLKKYTNHFMTCQLYNYSSNILYDIAIPTLFSFLQKPYKEYSSFLKECKVKNNDITIPFIDKQNVFHFIRHRGNDTFWKRATIFLNLPNILLQFYIKRKLLDKR